MDTRTDTAAQAAPDRPGHLHPLRRLRGGVPYPKAISHDANNYVVDPSICEQCTACIPGCPTGAIDNWRMVPTARAYALDEQFGWISNCPRS